MKQQPLCKERDDIAMAAQRRVHEESRSKDTKTTAGPPLSSWSELSDGGGGGGDGGAVGRDPDRPGYTARNKIGYWFDLEEA